MNRHIAIGNDSYIQGIEKLEKLSKQHNSFQIRVAIRVASCYILVENIILI